MAPPRNVLVTGASDHLGWQLAVRLAQQPSVQRVVAVDSALRATTDAPGVEFVRADIRNPLIGKVIATAEVDTVVHTAPGWVPSDRGSRTAVKEMHVLGSMQLLAACQQAPSVRRLIVTSSTAVYGSGPRDPAVFTERMEASGRSGDGAALNFAEVEEYVRGFARRRADVLVTVLRFADVVGPGVRSPLRSYLAQPVVPTVLGTDQRMQLLHSEDAVAAVVRASAVGVGGTWNVAGHGVLTVSQAVRRAGRLTVALPSVLTGPLALLGRGTRPLGLTAEHISLPGLGRVVDTVAAESALGLGPRWTTVQALDDFVTTSGLRGVLSRERVGTVERRAVALAGWWG